MKVLFGYDGSESSEAILDELDKTALPRETQIMIATAGEVWMPRQEVFELPPSVMMSRRVAGTMAQLHQQTTDALRATEQLLRTAAAQIRSEHPDWSITTEFLRADAADGLIEKAEESDADLIIVGTANRSRLGRMFLGSVSSKVVAEAGCSVRVARPKDPDNYQLPLRCVAGIDNPEIADTMVHHLERRRWPAHSVVTLVTATSPNDPDGVSPIKQLLEAQEFHSRAKPRLEAAGLKVLSRIVEDDPKSRLLTEVENVAADCVFVGSRNIKGALNQYLLGSVSIAIVTDAPCSVEVIRPDPD